ncbi:MAG: hypothetical protein WC119_00070 [Synergistaceae bacterium]
MIKYKNGFAGHIETLEIGDRMSVFSGQSFYPNCLFIKVTSKGFNILNVDTNRVVLKRHLYMRGMGGKQYPKYGVIKGNFVIPSWLSIQKKSQEREIAS